MKKFLSNTRIRLILGFIILALAVFSFFLLKNNSRLPENERFENFTEELFHEEIISNTLNLHYTLAYPEKHGIHRYNISLGSMTPDKLKKNAASVNALQKKLMKFSPENLSSENQIIYDILRLELATQSAMSSQYLLSEPLGPNLGIQAQLPVLLAEYTFRTSADMKDYFSLLSSIPDFFQEIIKFEQEKSKHDLFMSDTSADRIIQQCQAFTQNSKNNYLSDMFRQRMDELLSGKHITKEQYASYIEMNKKLMEKFVFPAYDTLAQQLSLLKGTGKNPNGLAYLPGGKSYYENLIKSSVGDYRSVKEIEQSLYRQLIQDYDQMQEIQNKDPDIISKAAAIPIESNYSPEQILDYLNHIMTDDFPALTVDDYKVKYVPESMEEFSSPAFYLTPPIDTLSPNTIYINRRSKVSQAELFTTLAHEGFPGHLYQTLYFGNQHKNPIRELLGCSGYVEGWATYVESLSYGYGSPFLGVEPDVMEFLSLNRSVSLCLYSILDIGIHYKGWTMKVVKDTLKVFGITDENVCREIFQYIVENPANYLKYYLGYLNFCSLRKSVQDAQGNSFDIKKFHQHLLEIGPAPFPVVKKYLQLRY